MESYGIEILNAFFHVNTNTFVKLFFHIIFHFQFVSWILDRQQLLSPSITKKNIFSDVLFSYALFFVRTDTCIDEKF